MAMQKYYRFPLSYIAFFDFSQLILKYDDVA